MTADPRQAVGHLGEAVAARFLERAGWAILARNYRCPAGEIDLVALDGQVLVFVEVRTRSGTGFGTPEESITPAKARRLVRCALTYLTALGRDQPDWRIDLIAIDVARGRIAEVRHYRHALQ